MTTKRNIKIMGILNVTPDSFYDGDKYNTSTKSCQHVDDMLNEGADIIDVGGYSTRPNNLELSVFSENLRVIPILQTLRQRHKDIILSVDTFRPGIAREACEKGCCNIINDISGGCEEMYEIAAQYKAQYVLMHFLGKNGKMEINHHYDNIIQEMKNYFEEKINNLNKYGVNNIIIDPGFGFSKSINENHFILNNLSLFKEFGCPILVGISRKSMVYKPLNISAEESLDATLKLNAIAIENGADILRVHDVKEHKMLVDKFNQSTQEKTD